MTTATAHAQIDNQMLEETLRLFFDNVAGKPIAADDSSAEVMAGFIALMYGPALQELEKQ